MQLFSDFLGRIFRQIFLIFWFVIVEFSPQFFQIFISNSANFFPSILNFFSSNFHLFPPNFLNLFSHLWTGTRGYWVPTFPFHPAVNFSAGGFCNQSKIRSGLQEGVAARKLWCSGKKKEIFRERFGGVLEIFNGNFCSFFWFFQNF